MTLLVDVGDRPSYLGDTNLSRDGSLVVISQDLPNFFSPSGTVLSVWQLWHTFRHLFAYEHSGTRAMSSWISSIRDSIHAIKSCIVGTLRFLTSYCGPGLPKGRINRYVLCKLSIFLPKLAGGGGLHEHAEVSNRKLSNFHRSALFLQFFYPDAASWAIFRLCGEELVATCWINLCI